MENWEAQIHKDKAFGDFIDSEIYEKATEAIAKSVTDEIWELVKAAYHDAWTKGQEKA